jgi:hypothetical protein
LIHARLERRMYIEIIWPKIKKKIENINTTFLSKNPCLINELLDGRAIP